MDGPKEKRAGMGRVGVDIDLFVKPWVDSDTFGAIGTARNPVDLMKALGSAGISFFFCSRSFNSLIYYFQI